MVKILRGIRNGRLFLYLLCLVAVVTLIYWLRNVNWPSTDPQLITKVQLPFLEQSTKDLAAPSNSNYSKHLPLDKDQTHRPPIPHTGAALNVLEEIDSPNLATPSKSAEPVIRTENLQKRLATKVTSTTNKPSFSNIASRGTRAVRMVMKGPQNSRQAAVVEATQHAWKWYKKFAWGFDELRPLSDGHQTWFNMALTMVDSLDTIYIMGMTKEFNEARDWIEQSLKMTSYSDVQLFEVVIRILGGLLSAYHLSGDMIFKVKALELGNKLHPCFNGETGIPCNRINLESGRATYGEISTAEAGTIQLEFRDLTRISGQKNFEDSMLRISTELHNMQKKDGLVSCFIDSHTAKFKTYSTVSAGASSDSYYEYLLKQWLQTGKTGKDFRQDFEEGVDGMRKHLLKYTKPNNYAFMGALNGMQGGGFRTEMEHLTCFLPGTLALAYMSGLGNSYLELAMELTATCYEMYNFTSTGLSPEVVQMNMNNDQSSDMFEGYGSSHNLQRPETVESLFYMYRATKDEKYRDWGWKIFQAFEKYTRVEHGYASINTVFNRDHPGYRDKMESFYLAETLKYLFLLFSDDADLFPLDKWVFNTEAHPLPIESH